MKHIFYFLIFFSPFILPAQKAKLTTLKSNYHYMRFALDESYNEKFYVFTITEQSSCGGLVPYTVKKTPLVSSDSRTRLYTNSVPKQGKYFMQSKEPVENLIAKRTPFTHFEIETADIQLNNQTTKNAQKNLSSTENLYYLEFRAIVPISVKATFYGNKTTLTLDTNSNGITQSILRFPMDYQFGTSAPDIKVRGYSTEASLIAAWKKYGRRAQVQWRDIAISKFITPVFLNYKKRYISYSEFTQSKIFSDKNKKGGYDQLVSAAELFISTMDEIEGDFKRNDFKKYWTKEYQRRFLECSETWQKFIEDNGNDLTKGDNLVSAETKQKIFLNFLKSLMFTGQFSRVEELIVENSSKKLKAGILFDMKRLKVFNQQLKLEFDVHSKEKGWYKAE